VLNLCRVKLRDQQRLERTHVLKEIHSTPIPTSTTPCRAPAMLPAAASQGRS